MTQSSHSTKLSAAEAATADCIMSVLSRLPLDDARFVLTTVGWLVARRTQPHLALPSPDSKPRRPNIGTMIKQAEKAGKPVSSVTRDGTTLNFNKPESTEPEDPWGNPHADVRKETKQ
jgi:hypothetical protein